MPAQSSVSYRIVRRYFHEPVLVGKDLRYKHIAKGLTLKEAMDHCIDPETSSSTCTTKKALAVTEKYGHWFDSYEEE